MSGRNRSQNIIMSIFSSRVPMLPVGDYKLHIDSVKIEKGSVKLTARILETIEKEEEDANES